MGEMEEYSDGRKIMLDYDRRRTPRLMECFTLLRMCQLRVANIRDDRTRKGWHRIISLQQELTGLELVALQACLSSDRRREGLNLMRLMRTRERGMSRLQESRWNILYRAKLT
jgi:hypothetical protein